MKPLVNGPACAGAKRSRRSPHRAASHPDPALRGSRAIAALHSDSVIEGPSAEIVSPRGPSTPPPAAAARMHAAAAAAAPGGSGVALAAAGTAAPPVWAGGRSGRAARAAVFACLTVGLSVAAHRASGGMAPSLPVSVMGLLLTCRVGWGVAATRVSLARLVALVFGVQAGLHLAFAMSAPGGQHGGPLAAGHTPPGPVTGEGVHLLAGGVSALAGHSLATLCLAVWLAAGERLVWRVASRAATAVRRAAGRLRRRRARLVPPAVRLLLRLPHCSGAARLLPLRHVMPRRGPPRHRAGLVPVVRFAPVFSG